VLAQVLKRYAVALEHPQLDGGGPLPPMLDFYETRFSVTPR
jgi:hypothetical protein